MVARVLAMKSATGLYEITYEAKLAEGVGFEPTRLSPAGFQDRCTRPLCESSVGEITRIYGLGKIALGGKIEERFDSDCYAIFLAGASHALGVLNPIWMAG